METPITDKAKRKIDGFADEWVPRYVSEELERKLAVAREVLSLALHVRGTSDDNEEVRTRMEEALTLTAPES